MSEEQKPSVEIEIASLRNRSQRIVIQGTISHPEGMSKRTIAGLLLPLEYGANMCDSTGVEKVRVHINAHNV